jgi:hypothetical protein
MSGQNASVSAQAVSKRDLANGQYKPQLVVTVPTLPLGPTGITVKQGTQTSPFMSVPDTDFVIAPAPIVIPSQVGEFRYQNFQAAVGRNGVVYLSLDLTNVTLPMVFQAQAKGYPLRFSSNDVVFYNPQGFLMQLLNQNMPGLGSTTASLGVDSNILYYSRHEFNTFYLQHNENQPHATDPADSNWHLDGTRHIDHDHMVLTIAGAVNGSAPVPGATPAFELVLKTFSLFHHGLVGASSIKMSNLSRADSYNSEIGLPGSQGDIRSNGLIDLDNYALVSGNATGASFSIKNGATITGIKTTTSKVLSFMPIAVPKELQNLGDIVRTNGAIYTLVGPASYKVGKIDLSNGAQLRVDNTMGPVTLYVTQYIKTTNGAQIATTDTNPEQFALYMVNGGDVGLTNAGTFYGVIYGPQSVIDFSNGGQFFGAFIGREVKLDNAAQVHYDTALRGE